MMVKDLFLQPVVTATLCSSRETENLAVQGTILRQLDIYTNKPEGGFIFKKHEKQCVSANFQKTGNGQQQPSLQTPNFAAPFKGCKKKWDLWPVWVSGIIWNMTQNIVLGPWRKFIMEKNGETLSSDYCNWINQKSNPWDLRTCYQWRNKMRPAVNQKWKY